MTSKRSLLLSLLFFSLTLMGCDSGDPAGNNTNNVPPACGDGTLDPGELCDGSLLNGETCASQEGYESGTLTCNSTCDSFLYTGCIPSSTCGDGVAEGLEACDGGDLRGTECEDLGLVGGPVLVCEADCASFDAGACTDCGNGIAEVGEVCDGGDLAAESCLSQGFDGGQLVCNADCLSFVTTSCTLCGNDLIEGAELCDGFDLAGQTCQDHGFDVGPLGCAADCSAYDTAGCRNVVCGDGVADGSEVCDGADLGGQDCSTQGFVGGNLACNGSCDGFDTSGCNNFQVTSHTQGPGLGLTVWDDGYDGFQGSMQCVGFNVPPTGVDTVVDVEVTLAMDHDWIGDLTIKLSNPFATTVTLLSRPGVVESVDDGTFPGGFGDTSDLAFTSPITFRDGAAFDAENMGGGITNNQVVCLDDNQCEFFPNPGAGPGTALGDFAGMGAAGFWELCLGDSEIGSEGTIDGATLTLTRQ